MVESELLFPISVCQRQQRRILAAVQAALHQRLLDARPNNPGAVCVCVCPHWRAVSIARKRLLGSRRKPVSHGRGGSRLLFARRQTSHVRHVNLLATCDRVALVLFSFFPPLRREGLEWWTKKPSCSLSPVIRPPPPPKPPQK